VDILAGDEAKAADCEMKMDKVLIGSVYRYMGVNGFNKKLAAAGIRRAVE